jgi:hypothetical protein
MLGESVRSSVSGIITATRMMSGGYDRQDCVTAVLTTIMGEDAWQRISR